MDLQSIVVNQFNDSTGWKLVKYEQGVKYDPVSVELIHVDIFPVQFFLKFTAIFPMGCIDFGEVKSKLINNQFYVNIYQEVNIPEGQGCDFGAHSSVKIIPLNVYGLKKGHYFFNVHDNFKGEFTIEKNNFFKEGITL